MVSLAMRPAIEEMLMIEPGACSRMSGNAFWQP